MNIMLPYPPTVNTYWRKFNNRMVISAKGRQYRKDVMELLEGCQTLHGRLKVTIIATMPDRRKRDLDNILKSLLDAMDHAGLFDDDEQIDQLHVFRSVVEKPGNVAVSIEELPE
jgi:crossover junction endodeoxyribonuclease RusA